MIHDSAARRRLRRGCVVVSLAAGAWALTALLTGGIALPLFSSRNPRNPALLAALSCGAAWLLAEPGRRRSDLIDDLRWTATGLLTLLGRAGNAWARTTEWFERLPRVVPAALAAAIAIGIILTSLKYTTSVAGASDAWGYVSHAHMWATGTLRQPQPLMAELSGFLPREAMAPLAYRPSPVGNTIVPVTSPGLPMLMALFERAGGAGAVFAVVPLLAALAVWATWLLGREVSDRWTGVLAAALLATSPAFLFQLTGGPMSDIPAAAFWTLSLAAAARGTTPAALASGAAAAMAILIRANLAPVAIVPAALLLVYGQQRVRGIVTFVAAVVPAGVFIAVLYAFWYGSPLNSGYGTLEQLYSAANFLPNLSRYSRWLLESQTPVVLVAALAPWLMPRRAASVALIAFLAAVLACYVFYIPFDAWWFLRFLLPAYPALMVLIAGAIVGIARRLPRPVRAVATILVMLLVADRTIGYAAARAAFDSGGELKYAIAGRYVADHLPANAVILCEQHSGSIRYYGGRTTIRFGSILPDHVDGVVDELRRLGYAPYLVVEDWEEETFRRHFVGRRVLESLAAGPQSELPLGHVRFYPLAR